MLTSSLLGAKPPSFQRGLNISHWLAGNTSSRPYAGPAFSAEDVAWIAAQGFDHLRMPVDGRLWQRPDGGLDEGRIAPFVQALGWARARRLGMILSVSYLPGTDPAAPRQSPSIYTDVAAQEVATEFWRRLARRFAAEDSFLRFELLNEPNAPDPKLLNIFNRRLLVAVRESNPRRIVYISPNGGSRFESLAAFELPADPAVSLTLHFYEPFIFTHQRATWLNLPPDMPLIEFPGRVPELRPILPKHWQARAQPRELTVQEIEAGFAQAQAWIRTHAAGREIYLGEFGVTQAADPDSRRRWFAAIRGLAEKYQWSWAAWDYDGGFGVRTPAGAATTALDGLFPNRKR